MRFLGMYDEEEEEGFVVVFKDRERSFDLG
jgi:hypothetical protein